MVELYEGEFGSEESTMHLREDPDLTLIPHPGDDGESADDADRNGGSETIAAVWRRRRRSHSSARSIF